MIFQSRKNKSVKGASVTDLSLIFYFTHFLVREHHIPFDFDRDQEELSEIVGYIEKS